MVSIKLFLNQLCNKKSTFPVMKPKIVRGRNETIEEMYTLEEAQLDPVTLR